MERPRFQLPSGEVVPKSETNKHHIVWKSYDYEHGLEKRYRCMPGFVIRMSIPTHNELHREVAPPIKPSPNFMRTLIDYQRLLDVQSSAYEKFQDYVSYLGYLSSFADLQQTREEAAQLRDNFVEQDSFLREGRAQYYG